MATGLARGCVTTLHNSCSRRTPPHCTDPQRNSAQPRCALTCSYLCLRFYGTVTFCRSLQSAYMQRITRHRLQQAISRSSAKRYQIRYIRRHCLRLRFFACRKRYHRTLRTTCAALPCALGTKYRPASPMLIHNLIPHANHSHELIRAPTLYEIFARPYHVRKHSNAYPSYVTKLVRQTSHSIDYTLRSSVQPIHCQPKYSLTANRTA